MHCGVMVTGYNQGDWERLMAGDYEPPARRSRTPSNMDDTLRPGRARRAARLRLDLGHRALRLRLFDAAEPACSTSRTGPGAPRRVDVGTAVIVAPWWNPVRLASEMSMLDILLKGRRLHLGIGRGMAPHEYASLGIPIEESHTYFYDVVNALRAADGAERFTFDGEVFKIPPTTIRPQARHKGELTTRIKAAFTTEASARLAAENGLGQMFVVRRRLRRDDRARCGSSTQIRAGLGLPPDQPTTLLWMYCAETAAEAEEGWEYFHNQLLAAQHHYFEWNNPGFEDIKGYEEYLERQTADVGVRRREPRGAPRHPADRHARRDHRARSGRCSGPSASRWWSSTCSTGGCPGQGREEPAPLRREGAPRGAGHAHADQPGVAGSAQELRDCKRRIQTRHGGTLDAHLARTPTHTQLVR